MITLEKLDFLREEVILTKPKENAEVEQTVWGNSALPQNKSDYVLMEVVKVGEKQQTVKTGDKVLISEQLLQDITIRDQGKLEDVFKITSADSIFAYVKT